MNAHWERLNTWHTQLGILADAFDHVFQFIDEHPGLSATGYVLTKRLQEMVEDCPFPEREGGSRHD